MRRLTYTLVGSVATLGVVMPLIGLWNDHLDRKNGIGDKPHEYGPDAVSSDEAAL